MVQAKPAAARAARTRLPVATRSGFRAAAAAKINLYLHVVGKRPDGYHLLDSLMAFADVHDTVIALPGDKLSLAVSGPFGRALEGEGDNLVLRAARKLAELGGVEPRARLRLIKRLPVASGIGGGSADAAAALRVLAALWNLRPAAGDLHRLALGLGADVPVCLGGRAMQVAGIGEVLKPAPRLPAAGILLVNPNLPLATPPVFKARQGPFSAPDPLPRAPIADAMQLVRLLAGRRNDLAPPAMQLLPAVGDVLAALERTSDCLLARMSGSGATCFGLFADGAAAATAGAMLAAAHPGWWVAPGRLVDDVDQVKPLA
jgi:4-diphosphocytidyl-2-C-methyl-D-erythritol kinase